MTELVFARQQTNRKKATCTIKFHVTHIYLICVFTSKEEGVSKNGPQAELKWDTFFRAYIVRRVAL
jgi:hypothetical protein